LRCVAALWRTPTHLRLRLLVLASLKVHQTDQAEQFRPKATSFPEDMGKSLELVAHSPRRLVRTLLMLGINQMAVENVMTRLDKVSTTIDAETPETAQLEDLKIHQRKCVSSLWNHVSILNVPSRPLDKDRVE